MTRPILVAPDLAVSEKRTRVWDPVVRIVHWTVVLGVFANLTVLRESSDAHQIAGYIVFGAVACRIAWGLFASGHARFSSFAPTPGKVVSYFKAMREHKAPRYVGHNPAGSVMIFGLIFLLLLISVTGWMMSLDQFWGVRWVEQVHEIVANSIIVAVFIHVLAAILVSFKHKGNLPLSMITGRKRPAAEGDVDNAPPAGRR
ncbi:MAG: cytochrome b/b6 domain-containing protein [Alphaproteobacteria bacterium]|nr:cytochrome b/b6 domain-containing protein [Alphaproteobacteria bacterium]